MRCNSITIQLSIIRRSLWSSLRSPLPLPTQPPLPHFAFLIYHTLPVCRVHSITCTSLLIFLYWVSFCWFQLYWLWIIQSEHHPVNCCIILLFLPYRHWMIQFEHHPVKYCICIYTFVVYTVNEMCVFSCWAEAVVASESVIGYDLTLSALLSLKCLWLNVWGIFVAIDRKILKLLRNWKIGLKQYGKWNVCFLILSWSSTCICRASESVFWNDLVLFLHYWAWNHWCFMCHVGNYCYDFGHYVVSSLIKAPVQCLLQINSPFTDLITVSTKELKLLIVCFVDFVSM